MLDGNNKILRLRGRTEMGSKVPIPIGKYLLKLNKRKSHDDMSLAVFRILDHLSSQREQQGKYLNYIPSTYT